VSRQNQALPPLHVFLLTSNLLGASSTEASPMRAVFSLVRSLLSAAADSPLLLLLRTPPGPCGQISIISVLASEFGPIAGLRSPALSQQVGFGACRTRPLIHLDFSVCRWIQCCGCHSVRVIRLLQGEASVVLELPDQKAQVFLVPIAVTWWFSEYARKVFGEIVVRTRINFWSDFCLPKSHTCL
jgi:hypothetical protein